jgi:amino acid adenylation domain-containing protein
MPSSFLKETWMVSTSNPERYSRPISPNEWCRPASLPGRVEEVQICVEGEGVIDPSALSAAVATAAEACPGARLVRRGRRWVDSGTAPVVKVTSASGFDRARLDSPLLRNLLTCYNSSCELVLVQGTPTAVIFRAHPGVMDGMGSLLWQRQVFRALRGEAVEDATSPLNYDMVMGEIAVRLGVDLPPPPPPPIVGPEQPGPPWRSVLGKLPSGPRRALWRRRTIDGTHPDVIAKIARLVTAHGDGAKEGIVEVPVDLRKYLPGLRTTAAVTGKVDLHVREGEDWTDVDASLLTALSEHQFLAYRGDPAQLRMPQPFLREVSRWIDLQARQNKDGFPDRLRHMVGVSNLGAVDLADFCADGFEATSCYCLGAVVFSVEFDVVECGGRTELTLAWRDGPGVAERAEALLDQVVEELSPRAYRAWDGNRTERPARPATLTGLFAEQVRRTPGAVAISDPDGDVSYAELSECAAAVTAALAARGIGRGDRVGLVAGRTPAAIAAIWGILGAGAAYLPIDAGYPDARITGLLTAAAAPACLLEPSAAQRDILPAGCQPIRLDELPSAAPAAPWPTTPADPADLACVIFTSGSTGTPKGVEIEHRALVNYVRWATREAGLSATDKMPLIASISFDMAGCAIYLPLLNGGTVLPVAEVNAATLREVIEDRGATAVALTPSHLDLINHAGVRHSVMRVIMTAGELLRRTTALRARAIFGPQCAILCQWGPTETTIVNTSHRFDPDRDTDPGVPFGRPMDNNTVYLLDSRGRHVPPGEPGEACVGGPQLARGYLGSPELTRQRFTRLADGTRIYHTGDIARLLPAGELSFIARADDQVKIAGHRIEPAEIIQALEEHPQIAQAAVIPRTRPGRHDKELCAYAVTTTDTTPTDLTDHLRARLPGYMIPAHILAVPDIPRTPNGKTDPAQLPDPFAGTVHDAPATTGRDDITTAISGIWARTLHIDAHRIDEHANFRELGGNSILLLSMIDEISRTVAADAHAEFMTELRVMIRKPTVAQFRDLVRQAHRKHAASKAMSDHGK